MTKEYQNFGDAKYPDDFYFSKLMNELNSSSHKQEVLIQRIDRGIAVSFMVERNNRERKQLEWIKGEMFIGDDIGDRNHAYTYDDVRIPATTVRQVIEKGLDELAVEYAMLVTGLEGKFANAKELARMEQSCHVVRIGYKLYPEDRILRMKQLIQEYPDLFAID